MLVLPRAELAKIHRHAVESLPEECCGFLLGRGGPAGVVTEARAVENVHPGPREVRYTVDPLEVLRLDRELRGGGVEHLGFYHSHPGHPPEPSEFDLDRAWPGYAYLILSVHGGKPGDLRVWRVAAVGKPFEEEPVSVLESGDVV